jgi:hypothetical protein
MSNGPNNVNDNVNVDSTSNYNDNVVLNRYEKSKRVERIADQLVAKFGNSAFRKFYCKIAWKLSEGQIWNNYEAAVKGNPSNPGKLFTYLCKRDGV